MIQYWQKFLNYAQAHKIISSVIIVALVFGGYLWYQKAHTSTGTIQYITQAAAKTTIIVSVAGSGQVSAANTINLKPGGSGQATSALTQVFVKQGNQVKAGQVIATVDEKNNNVALIQARASLASAQANYDNLESGATSIARQTAQLSVDTAQNNYNNTVTGQQQAVDKAYSNLLNTDLQAIPSNNLTTATLTLSGSYAGKDQGQYIISTYAGGDGLYYQCSGLGTQSGALHTGIPLPLGNSMYVTFGTSGTISPSTTWTISVPNLASSNYLNNNTAYQTALQTQTQSLITAKNSLTQAQLQLQSVTAPPTDASVAQAQAQIDQAQANLTTAEVNYDNNIIKSPFDGVVAQLNNQAGDQVSSSTVVATVITNQQLAVISLNENDATNVKVGQKANLTFEAVSGLNITGTVAEIDTIGAVSQGVVNYGAKIALDTQNDQIKPGMSVSVSIITLAKPDVLAVPGTAVKTDSNGNSYVQILDAANHPQNKTVQVGVSDDTNTEITSGLSAGDMVVTQTINSSAKTSTATTRTGTSLIPGLGGGGFRATGAVGGAARGGQ